MRGAKIVRQFAKYGNKIASHPAMLHHLIHHMPPQHQAANAASMFSSLIPRQSQEKNSLASKYSTIEPNRSQGEENSKKEDSLANKQEGSTFIDQVIIGIVDELAGNSLAGASHSTHQSIRQGHDASQALDQIPPTAFGFG